MKKLYSLFIVCVFLGATCSAAGKYRRTGCGRTPEDSVKTLVDRVHHFDYEALKPLSRCYLEGYGVPQSLLTSLSLNLDYAERMGLPTSDEVFKQLVADNPLSCLQTYFEQPGHLEVFAESLKHIEQTYPSVGRTLALLPRIEQDSVRILRLWEEEMSEQNETAFLLLCIFYEERKDCDALIAVCEKAQSFSLCSVQPLAKYYYSVYQKDFRRKEYLLKAKDCLYEADTQGILTRRGAWILKQVLGSCKEIGLPFDEMEYSRITRMSK